jgi:hypothetical protein
MSTVKETIDNILNGAPLDDEISSLIHEKRVCKHRGPREKRKSKRGITYWVRQRVCRGIPDATKSRKVKRALIGTKQKRSRSQRNRWRHLGSSPSRMDRRKSRRSRRR